MQGDTDKKTPASLKETRHENAPPPSKTAGEGAVAGDKAVSPVKPAKARRKAIAKRPDAGAGLLQGSLLIPAALLLLKRGPAHGYELAEAMGEFMIAPEPAVLYRVLRQMEKENLVSSEWKTDRSGPAKRIYRILAEGEKVLAVWIKTLGEARNAIQKFLILHEQLTGGKPEGGAKGATA